jgi:hypothetical protein
MSGASLENDKIWSLNRFGLYTASINAGASAKPPGERVELAAILARFFVPFCASFVPWNFWRRLVTDVGIRVSHCRYDVFP